MENITPREVYYYRSHKIKEYHVEHRRVPIYVVLGKIYGSIKAAHQAVDAFWIGGPK